MTDRPLKIAIASKLRAMGFDVDPLDEREDDKTPDLLVTGGGQRFLVEVKTKEDDPALQDRLRAQLAIRRTAMTFAYWGPRNTVAKRVSCGVRQLEAYPAEARDFSLLWLHASGADAASQFEQFRFTLYGATNVYSVFDRTFMRECFYFHNSAFYRWRAVLDGAICSSISEAAFFLNSYSPRFGALRESALTRAFANAVVDPVALEAAGEALLADCTINRRDCDGVKQYLQTKYKREGLDHIHVGHFTMLRQRDADPDLP
jgi:hypothetical protein